MSMRSAPGGSWLRIASSLVRTWNPTASKSVPQSNEISICAWFSLDVELISWMPLSVASASSTGRVICSSISWGVEPA